MAAVDHDPGHPGQVLAAERERQGLAPADIAQRLRMSVWQVEALEKGDYAKLPRGPFLRGFVRNYAKLLGVPADKLLARLAEGAPRDPVPRIVVPSQNIRFDPLSERIANPYVKAAGIATVLVVFGFAAMYWWLFIRNAPPPVSAARKPVQAETVAAVPAPAPRPAVLASPPPAPATPTDPAPPPKVEAPKVAPPKVEAPKAEPAKAEAPRPTVAPTAAADGGGRLKLRFKGKSWVEIRDARGKVLLVGLNDPGSEAEVAGQPPFRVVVGNAPEVQMYFNDREFNLEPHMRESVARATVQ